MGYSIGQLESKVKSGKGEKGDPGLPGIGFKLTDDGNFEIDEKRLTDLGDPIDDGDATTKKSNKNDVILRDGSQNMTGNLDLNDKKIVKLADSTDDGDAVNKKQLKAYTKFSQNNYHLPPSFRFYKDFGDKSQLTVQSPPFTSSDHFFQNHKAHNDAYIIEKEGYDTGFSGQAWSSIKMKGDQLPSGSYTSIFEIFVIGDAGGFRVDDTIIYHVYVDSHYTIDTFDSDKIDSQYTKSIIQFTTDGGAGVDDGIKFQLKYFGSQYNKNVRFIFYSRVIKGKQSTSFDHTIFNVIDVVDNHKILYFENLNLNGNLIDGLGDPVGLANATNKKYVSTEIAKISSGLLPLDGSKSMTGDLKVGGKNILNIRTLEDYKEDDPYEKRVKDLYSAVNKEYLNEKFLKVDKDGNHFNLKQKTIKNCEPYYDGLFSDNDLVSKAFVDAEIGKLPKPETDVLKLDGSKAMTGNLNVGDHTIIGIKSSSQDNSALTVGGAKSTYLPLIGDKAMQGGLNMGGKPIINMEPFVEDVSSGASSDTQKNEAITFGYFRDRRGKLEESIKGVSDNALNRKNPDPMESSIDMGQHSIVNLKDPEAHQATYAPNVKFVADAIVDNNTILENRIDTKIEASETLAIESIDRENVFKKVMDDDEFKEDDDDIHKIGVQNKNFHLVNKKTYEFRIDYDSSIGYYSTRLSIDLIYLPLGSYTMVYEMYINNGITIDEIDARSGTLTVGKINSRIDGTKTRSIIHFTKYTFSSGFDDLDIDIKLKTKFNFYFPQTIIYVVVYGVKGHVNNVSVNLWDRFYYYVNDSVKYEASIYMNKKDITGVNKMTTKDLDANGQIDKIGKKIINHGDGAADGDAVNKAQLDAVETQVKSQVTTVNNKVTQNKTDIATINRLDGYYYFTDQLKHDNSKIVKFPRIINSYPYSNGAQNSLRISLDGHYQIIYTDFYKKSGQFVIHDATNGNELFVLKLDNQSDWSPITINAIVPINVDNGFGHADIQMWITTENNAVLDGAGYSTFYIKYLHA